MHTPLTALITGASGGIGAELARQFAEHRHNLILVARNKKKLEALAAELIEKHGLKVEVIVQDLGAVGAAQAVFDEAQKRELEIDVLVNNAGILFDGPFIETSAADHAALVQLNITALTVLTHLCLPAMLERRSGRIMNIASTSSFQPVPMLSTYAASKAYVLSFSEALAIELKGRGVTVTALCPGFTETDMIAKGDAPSMSVPFVRNLSPQEVAKQGYKACRLGRPLHITGLGNKALIEFGRYQPRWLQRIASDIVAKKGF